jgi:hypothetical protein
VSNPLDPLFFVSYVHAGGGPRATGRPHERDRHVAQFFDLVSDHLAQLVPRGPGADPGFLDRQIPGGGAWSAELLNALSNCHVFVALLSAPYLQSAWCGREWHGFSQRKVIGVTPDADPHETAIIPVIWAPLPAGTRVPSVVEAVQHFVPVGLPDPDIAERYRRDGLYGLMVSRQEDAYQMVVWRLAQHIAGIIHSHMVEPFRLTPDDLRDVFQEEP